MIDATTDISEKWATVRAVLRNLRRAAEDVIATTAAGSVSTEYIAFSVYRVFRDLRDQLAANLDPALDDYLTPLRGREITLVADAGNVVAGLSALLTAIEEKAAAKQVTLATPLDAVLTGTVLAAVVSTEETQPLRDRLALLANAIQV